MASLQVNTGFWCGRLVADPELKQTGNGNSVMSFRIAVQRKGNAEFSSEETTVDFLTCVAWKKAAEFIALYFRKGDSIFIRGHLETRSYVEAQTNRRRYVQEIIVDTASFVDDKETGKASHKVPGQPEGHQPDFIPDLPTFDDDGLPL